MHLGIGLHMGLISFSIIMICHYSLFLTKKEILFIKHKLSNNKKLFTFLLSLLLAFPFIVEYSHSYAQETKVLSINDNTSAELYELSSISKLVTLNILDKLASENKVSINNSFMFLDGRTYKLKDFILFKAGIEDKNTSLKKITNF